MTCPLHERRFDLDTGVNLSGEDAVAAHRVVIRGDDVLVELAPRA